MREMDVQKRWREEGIGEILPLVFSQFASDSCERLLQR